MVTPASYPSVPRRTGHTVPVLAVALVFFLGLIDYVTGRELGFFVFYYAPIALGAWYGRRRTGVALSALSAAVWAISDLLDVPHYSSPLFPVWNTGIRLIAFLSLAIVVSKCREQLENQRRLAAELAQALSEVKQLKGLLPMCAWCKQVRNDEGYWEQIEAYVASRTDAEFTHGVCPECAEKLESRHRD